MKENRNDTMGDERKLVETAMLAGEIMLVSGAEIFRVENTMHHILDTAVNCKHTEFVLSTGITVTMETASGIITMIKRVNDRATNLNRIYLVNNVSRQLTRGEIEPWEAYDILCDISFKREYSVRQKFIAYTGVCLFFTMLLGGTAIDCIAAGLVGTVLAASHFMFSRVGLNDFCINAFSSFCLVMAAIGLNRYVIPAMNLDPVIIGAIMPLVPGVIFTTAIRDTLNGDYASGMGRILEAIVIALAVAAGAGAAMAFSGGLL